MKINSLESDVALNTSTKSIFLGLKRKSNSELDRFMVSKIHD